MKIEVLGPGCAKCRQAFEMVTRYVQAHGLPHEVVKVESIEAMMNYGLLSSPAVVIDGKVVIRGRAPRERELDELLKVKE